MFTTASWHIWSFRDTDSCFLGVYWYREETQTKTVAAEETKVRPRKRKADVAIVSSLKGFQTSMQMLFFIFQLHADEGFLYQNKKGLWIIRQSFIFFKAIILTDHLYY